jgi:hemerythrin
VLMAWGPSLSVGVPFIDNEHQELLRIANDLHDAMSTGKGQAMLRSVLEEMADYTKYHFAHEEAAMAENGYPGLQEHRAKHADLLIMVGGLQARLRSGDACLTVEVFEFLRNWLTGHIQGSDRAFGTWLAHQGVAAGAAWQAASELMRAQ